MTFQLIALALSRAWLARGSGAFAMGADDAVTTPEDESDARLVARVATGDERAFALVVRRHAGRLKALALGFTGQAGEADDIVQETFWSFWRNARRWSAEGPPLGAYLARIAMNRATPRPTPPASPPISRRRAMNRRTPSSRVRPKADPVLLPLAAGARGGDDLS